MKTQIIILRDLLPARDQDHDVVEGLPKLIRSSDYHTTCSYFMWAQMILPEEIRMVSKVTTELGAW